MERKKNSKNYPLYEHPDFINLKQLVVENAICVPDKSAFQYLAQKRIENVTYGQFYEDVMNFSLFLRQKGFRDIKIALLGENSYEWILSYFAVVLSGNVIVPMDRMLPDDELDGLLAFCDASVLIHSDMYADIGRKLLGEGRVWETFNMKDYPSLLKEGGAVSQAEKDSFRNGEVDADAVCSIIFTSGTTGKPKGVMLSQRNLMVDATNSCKNVCFSGASLFTLPLHHTFALTAGIIMMLIYRLPICISKNLRTFKSDMQVFKPHHMFLVPLYVETLYKSVWENARRQKKESALKVLIFFSDLARKCGLDLRKKLFHSILEQFGGNLELIISGGAPLPANFADGMEAIGIQVLNGYGITECSPVIAVNRNEYYRKNSVGLPLACCEIKIQDGEIWVKGPNIMQGYYHDEAATREVLMEGWFKTGDLGYLDEKGFLYVTGRKKNLIILGNGENVSPEELEEKIQNIENVREVLVYEKEGSIAAEIYAEDGIWEESQEKTREEIQERIQIGIEEKIAEMNRGLPTYKRVQKVIFRKFEFEKTTTKKIKR